MSWIYVTKNTWWKCLISNYHPKCIIMQEPKCRRCNCEYEKYDNNCNLNLWYTMNKNNNYDYNKIYCKDCIIIKNSQKNILFYLFNREKNISINK